MSAARALEAGGLRFAIDPEKSELTVFNASNGQRLFIAPALDLLCPVIDGARPKLTLTSFTADERRAELCFSGDAPVSRFALTVDCAGSEPRLSCSFSLSQNAELNALDMLPPGSSVNFYDLVNFRNHHGSPHTWPELALADDIDTTTFSIDWQFAPHPSMLLFRKNETVVLAAPLDLPKAFGFTFRCKRYALKEWRLDYGPVGHGEPLSAGQTWTSPVFALIKREKNAERGDYDANVYAAIDAYCALLIRDGFIPDPAKRTRLPWHSGNLYCTWVDEIYYSKCPMAMELDQQATIGPKARDYLDEALVRRAAAVIKRERLPVDTILIDSGWQIIRGQWEVNTRKFPNFRGLIDDLHDMGFKVILWVDFADIEEEAVVDEDFLYPGYINRHGCRVWNYSSADVRRRFLDPLIRRLISDEPGCYNADGIKTDFLADKVHPDMPCDPEWRGEENYLVHLIGHIVRTMKAVKPDSCHIGCAGHPYLAQYMDVIRTYDIFTSNVREHLNRGLMVRHCSAGIPVAFDFHNLNENLDLYFKTAAENGFSVEVGSILGMKKDYLAPWEPADAAFYQTLREGLALTKR